MPTYDYRCERTGEMFEQWQAFTDDPLTVCGQLHPGEDEACHSGVRKVFSKVGISFKGDGFYKNDHGSVARSRRSESDRSDSDPSGSGGSKSEGSEQTPSDSKPSKSSREPSSSSTQSSSTQSSGASKSSAGAATG